VNLDNPSLSVALAMGSGVLARALAHHLRIPGIVMFLTVGVLVGPDVGNLVRPHVMGEGLNAFVGFAVAIILFEGGLHMNLKKLRAQAKPIRRLVTIGALITGAGGALAARYVMGWEWRLAALFGTLVIVTGPTVITPLLRRLRVAKGVSTILEAEGIFIDAVGATIAVVALNVVLSESAFGALGFVSTIAIGVGVGLAGGAILWLLISRRRIIPEGLENVVGLAFALMIFHVAHAIQHESGITAAIVAGMVVSNARTHALDGLVEFKEQLVALLIATLFVLLSADVRVADVVDLGLPGLLTVACLIFVVRPLTVAASTYGTDLTFKEKTFLSWLAPRGIVAAAVASLFASELARNEVPGGVQMKALVFLVIVVTVTLQGLSGGFVAQRLGLRRPSNLGYAILGANPLARALAKALASPRDPVVVIDSNPAACQAARNAGLEAIEGNALEERTMDLAMIDARIATIALTENENVNFLFAKRVKENYHGVAYAALETAFGGVTAPMLAKEDVRLLFGVEGHLGLWRSRVNLGQVAIEPWRFDSDARPDMKAFPESRVLPMVVRRGARRSPVSDETELKRGDIVTFAIVREHMGESESWLLDHGFLRSEGAPSA